MDTKRLSASLKRFEQHKKGETKLTSEAIVPPSIDVRKIRQDLGLSQPEFASRFRISVATLRNWEQGVRVPEGPARSLLFLIKRHPELVTEELKQMTEALATSN